MEVEKRWQNNILAMNIEQLTGYLYFYKKMFNEGLDIKHNNFIQNRISELKALNRQRKINLIK